MSDARPRLRVRPAITPPERLIARRLLQGAGAAARLSAPGEALMTLIAWEGCVPVGCIDVDRARDGRFAMEARGVPVPAWLPRASTGEVSRWAATPRHGLAVLVALAAAAAGWMADEGMTHAVALLTDQGHRRLRRGGVPALPLGPPRLIRAGGGVRTMHPVWTCLPEPGAAGDDLLPRSLKRT